MKPIDYEPPDPIEREPPQYWVFFIIAGVIALIFAAIFYFTRHH
jgi:hypothetical protein